MDPRRSRTTVLHVVALRAGIVQPVCPSASFNFARELRGHPRANLGEVEPASIRSLEREVEILGEAGEAEEEPQSRAASSHPLTHGYPAWKIGYISCARSLSELHLASLA
jgi:hypothetical protein